MLPRPDPAAPLVGMATARRGPAGSTRRDLWVGVDQGSMMGMELVAAILTWTGIGWLLDRWLSTSPWLLTTGAIVGNAAGLYLVWLRSKHMNDAEEAARERARLARLEQSDVDAPTLTTDTVTKREEGPRT